jgi:hypothetical protein
MQTIRTKSEPGKVHRERRCKKCRSIVRTLELSTITIIGEKAEYQERIDKMTDLYEETQKELDKVKESLDAFFILNIPKKK